MGHLKGLETLLRQKHRGEEGKLWSPVRKNNLAKLHQTPNVWGCPMTRNGVMDGTSESVTSLANAMATVIASAHDIVDITSLDPPRGRTHQGVFWEAISGGIRELGRRRGPGAKVRFLFGFPPGQGREHHHARFKRALSDLWSKLDEGARPTIVYGVYARTAGSTGPYFNHAKIIACDAGIAVVGGHNLYDADYMQYPPVHDVSVEVWGQAAIDAQHFAAYLWEYGGISDPTVSVSESSESWNPFSSQGRQGLWSSVSGTTSSFLSNTSRSISNATQTTIVAWQLSEEGWTALSPSGFSQLFPGGGYTEWDERHFQRPNGNGYCGAKILTVGRAGGWAHTGVAGDRNASDYMKEYLFQNAAQAIRIAHQDLIAIPVVSGFTKIKHSTCQDLAAALQRDANLQVQVVVSAPWGCGRMDEYTNVPYRPQTAANYIMYYATQWGSKWSSERPRLYPLWKRLFVAPFHFTDKLPRGHYSWPDSDDVEGCEGARQGRLPQVGGQPFEGHDRRRHDGRGIGQPLSTPARRGQLRAGGGDCRRAMERYWTPLWRYSEPHAVQQWADDSIVSGE